MFSAARVPQRLSSQYLFWPSENAIHWHKTHIRPYKLALVLEPEPLEHRIFGFQSRNELTSNLLTSANTDDRMLTEHTRQGKRTLTLVGTSGCGRRQPIFSALIVHSASSRVRRLPSHSYKDPKLPLLARKSVRSNLYKINSSIIDGLDPFWSPVVDARVPRE